MMTNGTELLTYENGAPRRIGQYKDGQKHGQWVGFFETGLVSWIGNYIENVEVGLWLEWYENGEKRLESTYENGISKPVNFWDEHGNQALADGTGYIIEKFGASDLDVYRQYYKNGIFTGEEKIQSAVYGKFSLKK